MKREIKTKLAGAVFSLAMLVSGCGGFSGSYQTPPRTRITYPKYRADLGKRIEGLIKEDDVPSLMSAVDMYIRIGNLQKAEHYAGKILEKDPEQAFSAYQKLQEYRDKMGLNE